MLDRQRAICAKYHAVHTPVTAHLKVGIAENVKGDIHPINGLRHLPIGDTAGWFIWAGEETSTDPDFFAPLHVAHLDEWRPEVLPFLGLPPGWGFVIAPGYEDVWYDPQLLVE